MAEMKFIPTNEFTKGLRRNAARIAFMWASEPNTATQLTYTRSGGATPYDEARVLAEFGQEALDAWKAVRAARAAFFRAAHAHIDGPSGGLR